MKGLKFLALALAFLFVLTPFAISQDRPSKYLEVITVKTRPGAAPQFEDFVKKIVEGANKIGAQQTWGAGNVELGNQGTTYIFWLPFEKWGDRDGWTLYPEILSKAFGDKEAANIIRSGNVATESVETAAHVLLEDLTTGLQGAVEPSKFIFVRRVEVEREMVSDYQLFIAKVKEAQEGTSNGRRSIRRLSVMGPRNIYSTATPFNQWSERDEVPNFMEMMGKAHSEAEARELLDTVRRAVKRAETFVLRVRPDLSRLKASGSTTD